MDEHRRRKTVFAGTFAIARKSVSNSRPITLAERNALDRVRKGYTRAMYLLLSQCPRQTARARVGGGGLDSQDPPLATRQGKLCARTGRWCSGHALAPQFLSNLPKVSEV
jgi:hypothetical protein